MSQRPVRVLLAKPGLDGHERGVRVVARALEEAGMEVSYTGIRQTPEMIAEAARRFEAEAVGLSILSGAHMEMIPRVLEALRQQGLERALVLVGGTIPEGDRSSLLEMGVAAIFGPGARTEDTVQFILQTVQERRRAAVSRPGAVREG